MRLSNIANFLATEPDVHLATRYLALNACQSGFVCRIYIATLDRDLNLNHLSSFGFDQNFLEANQRFSLLTNPLLNEAINSEALVIAQRDENYYKRFSDLVAQENDHIWKSTVFLPLLPNFAAAISTQVVVEDDEESREYFGLLQSILNLYLQFSIHSQWSDSSAKKRTLNDISQKLTSRQANILEMIREGHTNGTIARKLGYSESLIRQETIVIYRKLGVDGRRELVRSHLFEESSNNKNA
jgi:DNA-binding CsgD family transcriptional regulator